MKQEFKSVLLDARLYRYKNLGVFLYLINMNIKRFAKLNRSDISSYYLSYEQIEHVDNFECIPLQFYPIVDFRVLSGNFRDAGNSKL